MTNLKNIKYTESAYLDNTLVSNIKKLEKLSIIQDKIAFKLELDYKLSDSFEKQKAGIVGPNNEFFCYYDEELVGYAGISSFGDSMAEVNGMIHPNYRRQNLFSTLIDSLENELSNRGKKEYFLLADASSFSGRNFVQNKNGILHHIEYEMELSLDTDVALDNESIELVLATNQDAKEISQQNILFSDSPNESEQVILPEEEIKRGMEIYLAKTSGMTFGKIHLQFHGDKAWIFGFVIKPDFRGKHLGKAVLKKSILLMRSKQVSSIFLQVDSENPVAYSLYKRTGFKELYAMEYYEIKIDNSSEGV